MLLRVEQVGTEVEDKHEKWRDRGFRKIKSGCYYQSKKKWMLSRQQRHIQVGEVM